MNNKEDANAQHDAMFKDGDKNNDLDNGGRRKNDDDNACHHHQCSMWILNAIIGVGHSYSTRGGC